MLLGGTSSEMMDTADGAMPPIDNDSFASLFASSASRSRAFVREMQCGGCVWSLCLAKDNSLIVTGSGDMKVSVWNTASGRLLREMNTDGECTGVHLSDDTKFIASADLGRVSLGETIPGKLHLWDTWTGKQLHSIPSFKGSGFNCVSISAGNGFLASGDEGHLVCLWDATSGEMTHCMQCQGIVMSIAISNNNEYVVSGDAVGDVVMWDVQTSEKIRVMPCETSALSVSVSPDDKVILSGESSGKIRLWLSDSGESGTRSLACDDEALSVRLSADKSIVVSGDFAHKIRIWDPYTGEELEQYSEGFVTECDGAVSSIALSADKKMVVSGDDVGKVIVWDIATLTGQAHDTDTGYNPQSSKLGTQSLLNSRASMIATGPAVSRIAETRAARLNPEHPPSTADEESVEPPVENKKESKSRKKEKKAKKVKEKKEKKPKASPEKTKSPPKGKKGKGESPPGKGGASPS